MDKETKLRYSRNLMLTTIGEEGQRKLLGSSVLVVGCGALGSIAAMYLAGSGVGRIGIADFDTIDISNLQRQIGYTSADVGKDKTEVLESSIRALNPGVEVQRHNCFLSHKNAEEIINSYDIVVEGSDNPDTKYLVASICGKLAKPYVIGGVRELTGQIATCLPGHAGYTDIFPEAAAAGGFTPCALGGLLGPLPGIVASIQACEAVKIIAGFGATLADRLLLIDAAAMTFTELKV